MPFSFGMSCCVFSVLCCSCFSQDVTNGAMQSNRTVPSKPATVPDSTELIAPGTPIQFDIVLPASEFLDQNRGGRYRRRKNLPFDEVPSFDFAFTHCIMRPHNNHCYSACYRRTNPFGEAEDDQKDDEAGKDCGHCL